MANKEYIEREAVLEEFDACKPMNWSDTEAEAQADWDYKLYRSIVADAPAADVVEVKHGTWKLHSNGSGTCDQCHFTQRAVYDQDSWQRFCGVCGARMDNIVC